MDCDQIWWELKETVQNLCIQLFKVLQYFIVNHISSIKLVEAVPNTFLSCCCCHKQGSDKENVKWSTYYTVSSQNFEKIQVNSSTFQDFMYRFQVPFLFYFKQSWPKDMPQ